MLSKVLAAFNLEPHDRIVPFGSGLINNTWKIESHGTPFILQRINHHVFRQPENISANIRMIGGYLATKYPDYLFTLPEKTIHGDDLFHDAEEGYFRMFRFVEGSHTIDVAQNPDQAYAAATEFGKFTRKLCDFPAGELKITIPHFHNLTLRYENFCTSLKEGMPDRIAGSIETIRCIQLHAGIVDVYNSITRDKSFRIRVTHHDTKISNVLFDSNNRGLCVIDLDTVMPGHFISDVGDMMRTYLCPVSEEEGDLEKIVVRKDFYEAIVSGYRDSMKDELTAAEKNSFMYAGQFMIYMQAIRFLTDHLNGDVYYGAKYPGHNLVRARNQLRLLEQLSSLNQTSASP